VQDAEQQHRWVMIKPQGSCSSRWLQTHQMSVVILRWKCRWIFVGMRYALLNCKNTNQQILKTVCFHIIFFCIYNPIKFGTYFLRTLHLHVLNCWWKGLMMMMMIGIFCYKLFTKVMAIIHCILFYISMVYLSVKNVIFWDVMMCGSCKN
jgi:hypothetical protein